MPTNDIQQIKREITNLKDFWNQRNRKFKSWYEMLLLVDVLQSKGLESYVSNEPMTFYNMAHYLLTRGDLSHSIGVETESALELDRRARVDRACHYVWKQIDRARQLGGNMPYLDELAFFILVLGWYSTVMMFDRDSGLLQAQLWNPYDTYPKYANGRMPACVHSYKLTEDEAQLKADENDWSYQKRGVVTGWVTLDDYFVEENGVLHNIILIDGSPVTGWIERPEMKLLIAPVAGFPDKGSLTPNKRDWRRLAGRSIFEVNEAVSLAFNKWKTMVSQILRDTAQPITQEFSATPQATPEQLRERGAFFHYAPGEQGLVRVPPAGIPIEVQAHLLEMRRELQKGSFSDAVYGMVEGQQPGYSLSLMASSSANQILYPYMDAKHFVFSEGDRFWLSNLKTTKRVFEIKGKFIEKLKPTDIPEDVIVVVESDVATSKDWLERGTIANQLRDHFDRATILQEVLGQSDPQAILRKRSLDRMLDHPMSQLVEMIAGYYAHADYLETRGDMRQAALFRRAAKALESQLGAPAPGQGRPEEMTRIMAEREAGTPERRVRIRPEIQPPEERGFTPTELRRLIGRGTLRVR